MDRYEIRYVSPDGCAWELTGREWVAGIKSGGIDGLVGDGDDVVVTRVGDVGQTLDYFQPKPMTGSLMLYLRGGEGKTVGEVWGELRQGFSRTRHGVLSVETQSQVLRALVRLSGPIPAPKDDPSSESVMKDVQIPLVADTCGWWTDLQYASNDVTVTNWGDLTVWPQIAWDGPGGEVILPSGAKFTLPAVSGKRTLSLDHGQAGLITDEHGAVDYALRKSMRGVLPEGVPAGETRQYKVPSGARLEWRIGVLSPWL
ncbi:hypothetical protein [Corynebacterium striatum]|uniref:hypothetical protein n=1 Tax=Corynebacterium striatum TaxID=43770 RepID=UPI0027B88212|nr:hypothetical protein [Corynebacterium striatum]